jgi:iron complex transport system permease protein
MPTRRLGLTAIVLLLVLAAGAVAVSLAVGSLRLPLDEVVAAFFGGAEPMAREVIFGLRLPRALAAFACGGLLAVAGALMQVLLRNPLADPYVLGVSGGAAVAAMLAILLGLSTTGINFFAFAGASLAMLLVFGLAHGDGAWTQARLLLTGVVIAAGCGAVVTLLISIAPEQKLLHMLFWLMGDLSTATQPMPALVALAVVLAAALPLARELNLLARGDRSAQALGVEVKRLRLFVYAIGSLATAIAVTTAGSVGFVGLIVPHLVRLIIGNDQRLLLPASALAGGTLLVVADTAARTLVAPQQLPVGVLTALLGVPLFLFLLSRQSR